MSTINSLVHHIDQLLTQHRDLQRSNRQLQERVSILEQSLEKQPDNRPSDGGNHTLEADLNHLIGLFDQGTPPNHD